MWNDRLGGRPPVSVERSVLKGGVESSPMQNGLQSKGSQAVECSRGGTKLLRSWWSCSWLLRSTDSGSGCCSRCAAAARSSGCGASAASRCLAAWGTAAACWCCTARSCTRRLRTAGGADPLGPTLWSLAAATVSSLSAISDQNDCQQSSKREHHLADHIKLLNRLGISCELYGMAPRRPELPDSASLDRCLGVYVDIPEQATRLK